MRTTQLAIYCIIIMGPIVREVSDKPSYIGFGGDTKERVSSSLFEE